MTRRLKLWFPGHLSVPRCFTEAHRRPEEAESLARELAALGIDCVGEYEPGVACCLCGSIWLSETAAALALRDGLPLIHYCWDLYPWQVEGKSEHCWQPHLWAPYLEQLRRCHDVWVPSRSAALRVREYAGRDAHVVLTACRQWDAPTRDGGYVVDVMRPYPDPMCGAVRRACGELGIPCVEAPVRLPFGEYKRAVAGARLLVSAYDEASTGGLTLLEGYALGKPVLLSDSPRLGARDYFGGRASYFDPGDEGDLKEAIAQLAGVWWGADAAANRAWVRGNYSDAAMAGRVSARLGEVL